MFLLFLITLAQPEQLTAQPADGAAILMWSTVDGADSYIVKRSTGSGGPYETIDKDIQADTYTDTTAVNGDIYFYVVAASNGNVESLNSEEVKTRPYPTAEGIPAIPSGLAAEASKTEVELVWEAVADADTYTIKRSTEQEGPFETVASEVAEIVYFEQDVTSGTQYYYVIQAVNSNGESSLSSAISVIPAEVIIVAQDDSGDYSTIQAALDSIPDDNSSRKVIFIKNGTYKEKVFVTQPYISFVGESKESTIIEWDDYGGTDGQSGNVGSTFESQTVDVTGDFFTASNITVLNSRALALSMVQQ